MSYPEPSPAEQKAERDFAFNMGLMLIVFMLGFIALAAIGAFPCQQENEKQDPPAIQQPERPARPKYRPHLPPRPMPAKQDREAIVPMPIIGLSCR